MASKQPQNIEEEEYLVEEVVDKRMKNDQVQYLVKWKGFGHEDDTWEFVNKLSCGELVSAFEDNRKKKDIMGKALSNSKKRKTDSPIPSDRHSANKKKTPEENKLRGFNRNLKPESILGATTSGSQIMFLMKWTDSSEVDWVPSNEAHTECPQIVIKCYEDQLQWTE